MLTSARQANVVRGKNKDFEIHQLTEAALNDGMNTLKDDDRRCLDSLGDVCALVQGEVVCGDLGVFARQQLLQLLSLFQNGHLGQREVEFVVCAQTSNC